MSLISASDRTCSSLFLHYSTVYFLLQISIMSLPQINSIINYYSSEFNLLLVILCTSVCPSCNIEQIFYISEMAFYHLLGGKSIIKELVSYKF